MTQELTTSTEVRTPQGQEEQPTARSRVAAGVPPTGYAAQTAALSPAAGAQQASADAEGASDTASEPAEVRVQITAGRLNVRSSPQVADDNRLGQLQQGDVVRVTGEADDGWLQIDYNGETGYISGDYTRPAPVDRPTVEAEGEMDTEASNTRYGSTVDALIDDYQNVPVWNRGQSEEEAPAATFVTPYVLNTPASVQTALAGQRSTHSGLATRNGGTVRSATGNRPFIGKGTPTEVQVVAQAAIDAGLTTPAGIQAYINNGPMNSSGSRRNGRWGVDCSGLTAIVVSEMAGTGRDVSGNIRSTDYRPGGSGLRSGNFTQLTADRAQAGDVISYMSTNHVVVVAERQDQMIYNAAGEMKPAIKLRVGESAGSGIRSTNTFWFVPGAARYGNTTPRLSPDVTLARRNADTAPTWENYNDGFRVITTGFNVGRYSIVRPRNNEELRRPEEQEPAPADPNQAGPQ